VPVRVIEIAGVLAVWCLRWARVLALSPSHLWPPWLSSSARRWHRPPPAASPRSASQRWDSSPSRRQPLVLLGISMRSGKAYVTAVGSRAI